MSLSSTFQSRPISVVLDGSNYVLWNHHMTIHVKSLGLFGYISGLVKAPVKGTNGEDKDFANAMNDWDMQNAKIIGFINGSTITEIHNQLIGYSTAKEVWDFIARRFTASGLAHQYQLWSSFQRKRQLADQSISSYVAEMKVIQDQLNMGTPHIFDDTADKFRAYFSQLHLITLLMGLIDKFESVRASLLHRQPLPIYDDSIAELLSEETRLQSHIVQSADVVLHVDTERQNHGKHSDNWSSGRTATECTFCHSKNHLLLNCPVRHCRVCRQKNPRHYASDCPQNFRGGNSQRRFTSRPLVGTVISDTTRQEPPSSNATRSTTNINLIEPTTNINLIELVRRNQELMEHLMSGSLSTNGLSSSSGSKDQGHPWSRP
ncbi:unnamed protein product [Cuscuta europaea]|uniref:Retrotransposon Copia-like N-terminal domain-containing protein n=1 Tax=Cuscuta europaea TaxID=41803 RepID=A0A9P0ZFW4_CUSEU|nr:unnamed protein product [Cuscuta europaea]